MNRNTNLLRPHTIAQAASAAGVSRREWLKRSSALMAGSFGTATLGHLALGTTPAYAANYKALVCIFLLGGNDGMNLIVPTDSARYNQYAGVRGAAGLALPQSSLVRLTGSNYGLHPSLSALKPFWDNATLAPVFNVGPLFAPLTKDQYRSQPDGSELIPDALFSHSDQQFQWETSTSVSQTRTGWGGRASTELGTANPVISLSGNPRFGIEELRSPLALPGPGSFFGAYDIQGDSLNWEPNRLKREAIDALYANPQKAVLGNAYADQQEIAFEVSQRLVDVVASRPGDADSSPEIDSAFASLTTADGNIATYTGQQLYQIAKLIRSNAIVQGNRQIFFASQGGYDTHSDQVAYNDPLLGLHAGLLKELGDALAAFQQAMNNLGMSQSVTAFTQSDFGRTFTPNSTLGTDHAWGNNHLVIGGSVKGKATYGTYPELVLGGKDDVGVEEWELQGRWIPTSGVDQYASTMLGWFGADSGQIDRILPNLVNYGSKRSLGFL
jgi:uncharacterized protein (DUF1501 family)